MNAQRLFRNLSLLNKVSKTLRWLDIIKIAILAASALFCGFELIREYAAAKNGVSALHRSPACRFKALRNV